MKCCNCHLDKKIIIGVIYLEAVGDGLVRIWRNSPDGPDTSKWRQKCASLRNDTDDRNDNNLFISDVPFESVIKT